MNIDSIKQSDNINNLSSEVKTKPKKEASLVEVTNILPDFNSLGIYQFGIENNSKIISKLDEIEKKHNIKIIYASEIGSKSWGSDSKDSDHDIRFIYVSPKSAYFDLNTKDTIKSEFNKNYDIYGYDISKIIKQIKSQDYTPFEWIASPKQYKQSCYSDELKNLILNFTNKANLSKAYKKLSVTNAKRLLNSDKIDIKSYLILIKSVIMADYIDKTNKFPPLTFSELFDFYEKENPEIVQTGKNLLNIKRENHKKSVIPRISLLDKFIENKTKEYASQDLTKTPLEIDKCIQLDNLFDNTVNSPDFNVINKIIPTEEDIQRLKLYPKDNEYRKKILSDMDLDENEYLSLKSIVGPQEFKDIISNFNNNPEVYSNGADKNSDKPEIRNVIDGKFRANLHIHTNYSDGKLSVQKLLDNAAQYADKIAKNKYDVNSLEPFTIAITDHNTLEGCKEAVRIIRQNPDKYKNLRVVLGCELSASEKSSGYYTPKKPYQIHLLSQCINPFDRKMNNELDQRVDKNNPCYISIGSISDVMDILSEQKDSLVGYAHPLEHQSYNKAPSKDKMPDVIKNLIKTFMSAASDKTLFVENYYQSYNTELGNNPNIQREVKEYCDDNKLISTGGLDTHGDSIFFR